MYNFRVGQVGDTVLSNYNIDTSLIVYAIFILSVAIVVTAVISRWLVKRKHDKSLLTYIDRLNEDVKYVGDEYPQVEEGVRRAIEVLTGDYRSTQEYIEFLRCNYNNQNT